LDSPHPASFQKLITGEDLLLLRTIEAETWVNPPLAGCLRIQS